MTKYTFEAVLQRPEGAGTWTYLDIPFSVVETFGVRGQLRVCGAINGYEFRTSARPHGDGTHYIVVNSTIRSVLGVAKGDRVRLELERDTAPRTVEVPPDFRRVLSADPTLQATFEALSYSHKKEYVDWIDGAKRAATRERRIAKAQEMLRIGATPKGR